MSNNTDTTRHLRSDSVGLVEVHKFTSSQTFTLESGQTLSQFDMLYETYGELNADKSNAILVCHALSSNHHAAGFHSPEDKRPGWWDDYIGPGKTIDTTHFFVLCANNLGGCFGSTGPLTINPKTGKQWANTFPLLTIKDWINSQKILIDSLGITRFAAIIGGSMGGMQALQWAIDYPDYAEHTIVIAAAPKLSAQNIAFNEVARQAIMSDPQFHDGRYSEHGVVPEHGLKVARMLAHITYLSDEAMRNKFGRDLRSGQLSYEYQADFQVESYLRYQGESFSKNFDANSYLLLTKILDYFDPARDFNNNLTHALAHVTSRFLVVSFSSDWRFSPERSVEMVDALMHNKKTVSYAEITASQGHDSFLLDVPRYKKLFASYMQCIAQECSL